MVLHTTLFEQREISQPRFSQLKVIMSLTLLVMTRVKAPCLAHRRHSRETCFSSPLSTSQLFTGTFRLKVCLFLTMWLLVTDNRPAASINRALLLPHNKKPRGKSLRGMTYPVWASVSPFCLHLPLRLQNSCRSSSHHIYIQGKRKKGVTMGGGGRNKRLSQKHPTVDSSLHYID